MALSRITLSLNESPMDRLDAMRMFVAVVRAGSLTAASRELRVPLPTVSRRVAQLERHLGATLLVRSTRRLELTQLGRSFLAASERILHDVEEAEALASDAYQS